MHLIAHLLRREVGQPLLHLLRRHAEDKSRRECRQCVADIMPSRQRDGVFMTLAVPCHHEARAVCHALQCLGTHIRSSGNAIRHDTHSSCRTVAHCRDTWVVSIEDHRAAGGNRRHQLRLCLGNVLDRAEELHVHLADIRYHADRGCGDRCKRSDLPHPAHPDLHDRRCVLRRDAEQGQRQADLIVVVCRRAADLAASREYRRREILRRGLAVRSRNRDDGDIELHAPCVCNVLIGAERILRHEDAAARCIECRQCGRRCLLIDENCRRTAFECLRCKRRAVKVLPAQRDKEIARRDLARVRRNGQNRIPCDAPTTNRRPRRRANLVPCQPVFHALLLIASRACSRSSK